MACKIINIPIEQVRQSIKNRRSILVHKHDRTAEDTLKNVEYFRSIIKKDPDTGEYLFEETGEKAVSTTVTQKINKKFERAKGKTEADRISNLPDSQLKKETGTNVHNFLQDLFEGKTPASRGIPQEGRESLTRLHKKLISEAEAKQEQINKELGTKGKVQVITELPLLDGKRDLGGTVDLIFLYSDNTADLYDFKTFTPFSRDISGEKIINEDFLPKYKIESYEMQQRDYKIMLTDVLGISHVRKSRIVPIQVGFTYDSKKEVGSKLGSLKYLHTDNSEFLNTIPVAFEETENEPLNQLIRESREVISKLTERLETVGLSRESRERINMRINTLQKSIRQAVVDADMNSIFGDIADLIRDYDARKEEMELKELIPLRNEMQAYSKIIQQFYEPKKKLTSILEKGKLPTRVAIGVAAQQALAELNSRISNAELNEIDDVYKDKSGQLKERKYDNWWMRLVGRVSEFTHPIFKRFKELVDSSIYKTDQAVRQLAEEIHTSQNNLFAWAKEQGLSKKEAYAKLINPDTGNMYSHLQSDFWKERDKAYTDKDFDWLKKNYSIRKTWQENYDARLETIKKILNSKYEVIDGKFSDTLDEEKNVLKNAKTKETLYNNELKRWKEDNDLVNHKTAWFNKKNSSNLELKQEIIEANYSEEYKYIRSHKPLLEFYEMIENRNNEFREMLGLRYHKLPPNFIANIRADVVERISNGDVGLASKELIESLAVVQEEDTYIGRRDINTGEEVKNIPLLYMNPFKDKREKSYDLATNLLLFGKMAYNHAHMAEIEANVLALKTLMENDKEMTTDANGNPVRDSQLKTAFRQIKTQNDLYQTFDDFANYYLYGIKFQEGDLSKNTIKRLLKIKQLFSIKTLGFGFIPAGAAAIAGRTAIHVEASKGVYFNHKQMQKTMSMMGKEYKKYRAFSDFFSIHAEDFTTKEALSLSAKGVQKHFDVRTMFMPFREVDENLENLVMVSMAQNYGFDSDGNLKKLENLPEDSKSIWDLTTFENGELNITGLTDKNHQAFRQGVMEVAAAVKGSMSSEDISRVDTMLMLNMGMQFKSWMPAIIEERFGSLKYRKHLDTAKIGRYTALGEEFKKMEDTSYPYFLKNVVAPNIGKFMMAMLPLVKYKSGNKEMLLRRLEEWKALNPEHTNDITEEQYVELKERQIKAMAAELRAILLMTSLILALGMDWDDDGEPLYSEMWFTRQVYKVLSRGESEMAFMYNPKEFLRLTKNPFPTFSLLGDIYSVFSNTSDEIRDYVFGENTARDKTPWGYYSSRFIPGMQQFRRIIELYEQDASASIYKR